MIGLHTPFEDHDKQRPEALEAFVDEHELPFPIAVDKPNGASMPKTMEAYEIRARRPCSCSTARGGSGATISARSTTCGSARR